MSQDDINSVCISDLNPVDVPVGSCAFANFNTIDKAINSNPKVCKLLTDINTLVQVFQNLNNIETAPFTFFLDILLPLQSLVPAVIATITKDVSGKFNFSVPLLKGDDTDECKLIFGDEWTSRNNLDITKIYFDTLTGLKSKVDIPNCGLDIKPDDDVFLQNTKISVKFSDLNLGTNLIFSDICTRKSNLGLPETCCFQDANNYPTPETMTDPDLTEGGNLNLPDRAFKSCAFGLRNLSSDVLGVDRPISCRNVVSSVCKTDTVVDINNWFDQERCYTAFKRIVSANPKAGYQPNNPVPVPQPVDKDIISADANSQAFVKAQITSMFNTLKKNQVNIFAAENDFGFNPVVEDLFGLCKDYPFVCQEPLEKICSEFDTNSLGNNPNSIKWCGCHLPAQEYSTYTDDFNIPKECSPHCNSDINIPVIDVNKRPLLCAGQNICVIDDVSINYASAQTNGKINFKQICGGCGDNNTACKCLIQEDKITSLEGGDINISEICGSQNIITTDAFGNKKLDKSNETPEEKQENNTIFISLGIFILAVLILGVIFLML